QVIDDQNNWYDDKGGKKINTILINPLINFFKDQFNNLLLQKQKKLNTYPKSYINEILPFIINKKDNIYNTMINMKKTKDAYKMLNEEYLDISQDLKILEMQIGLLNDNKIYDKNLVINICFKY